jgi:hypothetical protein
MTEGTQLRSHHGQRASRSSTGCATEGLPSACVAAAAGAAAALGGSAAAAVGLGAQGVLLKHWLPGVLQHLGTGTGTPCSEMAGAAGAPAAPE